MASKGRDVDKTRAINIFLVLGIIRFRKGDLSEGEQKIIDTFVSSIDMDFDSAMDEIGTPLLKILETEEKKNRPIKT